MQVVQETKINFVWVIILPRTRPQSWAIGYNLSSLRALNLIVKLVTITCSHFRSLTLMSIWCSSKYRNQWILWFHTEMFFFLLLKDIIYLNVFSIALRQKCLRILCPVPTNLTNMSQEACAPEFLVSNTTPHAMPVDLQQQHSPQVKSGLSLWIHFCNNDAGNAVMYYFNRIIHWTLISRE